MSNIWAFKYFTRDTSTEKNNSSVPILVPTGATNENANFLVNQNSKITTLDVVKNYNWTYSPQSSRVEVPSIILTEKRLKTNALVSQLLYSFGASQQGLEKIKQTITETIGKDSGFIKALDYLQKQAGEAVSNAGDALGSTSVGKKFLDAFSSIQDENAVMNSDLLKGYKNLYLTQDTGWRYIFPYFDNYSNDASNAFGSDTNLPTLGALRGIAEGVASFNEAIAVLQNPLEFSFAERSKFYSYPEQGDEISFEFPLINTGSSTYEDVKKNWQLLFLLLYQNKPSRVNANVIEPPVLYQVELPGQKFLPFAYITKLAVDFKGSRRSYTLDIPVQTQSFASSTRGAPTTNLPDNQVISGFASQDNKKITTIIPDAYTVKISLKGLIADSRNFMAAALESDGSGDFNTKISVRDKNTARLLDFPEADTADTLDLGPNRVIG